MAGRKYEQDRSKVHKTTLAISVSKQEKTASFGKPKRWECL